jgi:wyosine [tRNA(Phe)-imidazoG37] synthetase (radical SAM superfamily)
MNKAYKYLFGPVPSRRFGFSLGVDLVPHKTCSLNCVFCEVGPTTCLAIERKEYVPVAEIERELTQWRGGGGKADVISVTGAGEPTLHSGFGEILGFIRREIKIKSVLLTNSTLMHLPEVRRAASGADIVKATFSAWDEESFRNITRPHPGLRFLSLLEGLQIFRREYSGELWLEIFIVPGINSGIEQVKRIAELARSISPDKIQLNTAVRPTAQSGVTAASEKLLNDFKGLFEPQAEVIARYAARDSAKTSIDGQVVLAMLTRRPCTAEDVAAAFSLDIRETRDCLRKMVADKKIRQEIRNGEKYYLGVARQ